MSCLHHHRFRGYNSECWPTANSHHITQSQSPGIQAKIKQQLTSSRFALHRQSLSLIQPTGQPMPSGNVAHAGGRSTSPVGMLGIRSQHARATLRQSPAVPHSLIHVYSQLPPERPQLRRRRWRRDAKAGLVSMRPPEEDRQMNKREKTPSTVSREACRTPSAQ